MLSEKHRDVALAYIADPEKVGWRAYTSVYPKSSRHAAETGFSRLLKIAEFAACVADLAQQAVGAKVMSAQEVLEELSTIGRANMRHYGRLGMSGDVTADMESMPAELTAAISEITVDTYGEPGDVVETLEDQAHGGKLKRTSKREVKRVKLKLHSKTTALDLLGRHHKLYVERVEHDFSGVAARLAAAIARTGGEDVRREDGEVRPDRDPPRARRARKAQGARKRARPRRGGVRAHADLPRDQRAGARGDRRGADEGAASGGGGGRVAAPARRPSAGGGRARARARGRGARRRDGDPGGR
jgi:hypothetical protein